MNKRKKIIYASILVLGGLALLTDRLLFDPSVPVAAAQSPMLGKLGVETSTTPNVSVAATPFPSPLPEYDPLETIRDVFATTTRVRSALLAMPGDHVAGDGRSPHARPPQVTTAARFRQTHRLKGVMVSTEASLAVIDNTWLRVGDSLNGCTLTEIGETSVRFKCANSSVSLSVMEGPSLPEDGT